MTKKNIKSTTNTSSTENEVNKTLENPIKTLFLEYVEKTPSKLKIIDAFLAFCLSTSVIQMIYVSLVGSFPKNSFLSGVLISIALFVLGVALRKQINTDERENFPNILPERAYVDYLVAGILVLLVGVNYMG